MRLAEQDHTRLKVKEHQELTNIKRGGGQKENDEEEEEAMAILPNKKYGDIFSSFHIFDNVTEYVYKLSHRINRNMFFHAFNIHMQIHHVHVARIHLFEREF